jgi:hypothetical protein
MRALAKLLRRDSPEPLNEPFVPVIALVGEPDAGAQPQTARILACNDGADDWSSFTLSDVRQERFEDVATKRHWPVVIERVDLCENGALKVGSNRRALQVGRGHDLSTVPDELRFVRPGGDQPEVVELEADDCVIGVRPPPVVIVSQRGLDERLDVVLGRLCCTASQRAGRGRPVRDTGPRALAAPPLSGVPRSGSCADGASWAPRRSLRRVRSVRPCRAMGARTDRSANRHHHQA